MKAFTWIALSVLLAITTRFLLVGVYKVPSYSMSPSLVSGDYILVSKMAYGLKFPWTASQTNNLVLPKYGDIVILNFKKRQTTPYVKRVMARPGDKVTITAGRLEINGKPCEYKKIDSSKDNSYFENCGNSSHQIELPLNEDITDKAQLTVPPGHVFVLNDSRESNEDSRTLDFVQVDQIAGKVVMILYSYGTTQDSISEDKSIQWN